VPWSVARGTSHPKECHPNHPAERDVEGKAIDAKERVGFGWMLMLVMVISHARDFKVVPQERLKAVCFGV
jgi:hypothetical protein